MGRLLLLLFLGALLVLCHPHTRDFIHTSKFCASCDEYVGMTCRTGLGICKSRYPDFACQTKEVYTQQFTGEYLYKHSILSCPKRCVEYVRITKWEKNIFICCNESYCNSLTTKESFLPERNFV